MPFKTRFKTTTVFGKRFANAWRRERCLLTYWVERRYGSRTVVSYLVSGSARGGGICMMKWVDLMRSIHLEIEVEILEK
jgi:hypothetical protein